MAPYDYIFLWDEDLSIEAFDAEEYLKIARKHGLEISQPGLDITRGPKPFFDITVRRNGSEMHKYVFFDDLVINYLARLTEHVRLPCGTRMI